VRKAVMSDEEYKKLIKTRSLTLSLLKIKNMFVKREKGLFSCVCKEKFKYKKELIGHIQNRTSCLDAWARKIKLEIPNLKKLEKKGENDSYTYQHYILISKITGLSIEEREPDKKKKKGFISPSQRKILGDIKKKHTKFLTKLEKIPEKN